MYVCVRQMEQTGELLMLFCREKSKGYDPFLWLPSSVNRRKKKS